MTQSPLSAPAGRGAVDLSALGTSPPQQGPTGGTSVASGSTPTGIPAGLVVEASDATFGEVVNRSLSVPAVAVLWTSRSPESSELLASVAKVAATLEGRVQVVSVDVDANPGIVRAFQVQQIPVAMGLVQGQPVPLFVGLAAEEEIRAVLDQFLTLAVQHGVAGRIDLGPVEGAAGDEVEEELPALHQAAFDAIEAGDFGAATAAYEQALRDNPADQEAQLGLAQVGLLERTATVDPQAVRAAAAADPGDLDAALTVSDLDILGGQVEDAFTRLIELVRSTSGDERDRVRTHLLDLFAVVGNHDERVRKGRTALMSALF